MEALDLAGEEIVGAGEEFARLFAAVHVQAEAIGVTDVGKAARTLVRVAANVQVASGAERGTTPALGDDRSGRVLALHEHRHALLLVHQTEQKRQRVVFKAAAHR